MLYIVMHVSSETSEFRRSPISHVKQCLIVNLCDKYLLYAVDIKKIVPSHKKGTSPNVSYGVHYISLLVILTESKRKEQLPSRT